MYTYKGILFVLKKEVLTSATTWMNLESVLLSERSQTQKANYGSHLYAMPRMGKLTKYRVEVTRGWAGEDGE